MDSILVDRAPQPWVHPCLRCGACCAYYRASFYWAEADDATPGGVPVELTAVLSPHLRVMRGTNQPKPRCVALHGEIGTAVHCSIHPQRSSSCRDYPPSLEDGTANPRCDEARAAHGLAALTPDDWLGHPRETADRAGRAHADLAGPAFVEVIIHPIPPLDAPAPWHDLAFQAHPGDAPPGPT